MVIGDEDGGMLRLRMELEEGMSEKRWHVVVKWAVTFPWMSRSC